MFALALVVTLFASSVVDARFNVHRLNNGLAARNTGPLPSYWTSAGCFTDTSAKRTLNDFSVVTSSNSPQSCIQTCNRQGFKYAGVEFGSECYCSNRVRSDSNPNTGKAAADTDCIQPCSGDPSQSCGNGDRIHIFQYNAPSLPAGWKARGCFTDDDSMRALPNLGYSSDSNTPAQCATKCAANGFILAGVEFGKECWCGNSIVHSRSNPDTGSGITDSLCNQPCSGDSSATCGAAGKIFVYHSPAYVS